MIDSPADEVEVLHDEPPRDFGQQPHLTRWRLVDEIEVPADQPDPPYLDDGTDDPPIETDVRTVPRGMICGFVFEGGWPCAAHESHPVHHGKWFARTHKEPDHDFIPLERRSSGDRRAQP